MKYFFFLFFALTTSTGFTQDDLLSDLMKTQDTITELLPKKETPQIRANEENFQNLKYKNKHLEAVLTK